MRSRTTKPSQGRTRPTNEKVPQAGPSRSCVCKKNHVSHSQALPPRITHLSRDDNVRDATSFFLIKLLVVVDLFILFFAYDLHGRIATPLGTPLERAGVVVFFLRMVGLVAYILPSLRIMQYHAILLSVRFLHAAHRGQTEEKLTALCSIFSRRGNQTLRTSSPHS